MIPSIACSVIQIIVNGIITVAVDIYICNSRNKKQKGYESKETLFYIVLAGSYPFSLNQFLNSSIVPGCSRFGVIFKFLGSCICIFLIQNEV